MRNLLIIFILILAPLFADAQGMSQGKKIGTSTLETFEQVKAERAKKGNIVAATSSIEALSKIPVEFEARQPLNDNAQSSDVAELRLDILDRIARPVPNGQPQNDEAGISDLSNLDAIKGFAKFVAGLRDMFREEVDYQQTTEL